ncbi:MAG: 3-oxoacyl-[Oscillospiraceae bacterium]|nr:3-oxoacyl-[acyl-carrier-protein] reductase [Oscillospiraceae bacterium]
MLTGRVAIVTGGSRGIGAAIAVELASQGADVAVIYAGNEAAAEAVCARCRDEYGVRAASYRCDVADFAAVKETVDRIKADFGTVNILVNNAGITRDNLVARMKESEFDEVLQVNLKGAFNMIRHCSGIFLRNKGGSIINISSVSGKFGNPGQANYAAAKAGLLGLTRTVARELAPKGITCNAVAPGYIETDMTAGLAEHAEALTASIPLGRAGTPEDVARAVAFLAAAPYITGEVLRVDGGLAI